MPEGILEESAAGGYLGRRKCKEHTDVAGASQRILEAHVFSELVGDACLLFWESLKLADSVQKQCRENHLLQKSHELIISRIVP